MSRSAASQYEDDDLDLEASDLEALEDEEPLRLEDYEEQARGEDRPAPSSEVQAIVDAVMAALEKTPVWKWLRQQHATHSARDRFYDREALYDEGAGLFGDAEDEEE